MYMAEDDLKIVRIDFIATIGKDGNANDKVCTKKVCLKDENGKIVSNYYYDIDLISKDTYIVLDVATTQNAIKYTDEFDEKSFDLKYGVICLQRDENNKVIPMVEQFVVPKLYDRLDLGNSNTLIGYTNNNHLTYIEFDPESKNYGKQIIPAILNHAFPFDIDYKGFAECSVNDGFWGYLPRNFKPKKMLCASELLTEDQVKHLLSGYSKGSLLHDGEKNKYMDLTGKSPKVLKYIQNKKND